MPAPFPTWLLHSGLPQVLTKGTCGSAAWLLLKTIIELDCRLVNSQPVDIAVADLAIRAGLDDDTLLATMPHLRTYQLAKYFLPDDSDDNTLIQLNTPLPTPRTHKEVLSLQIPDPAIAHHRYCDCPEAQEMQPDDVQLQEVIDLYLSIIGCSINAFIVDRLHRLRSRADIGAIRFAFRLAEKNNTRNLAFVERQALKLQDKRIKNR